MSDNSTKAPEDPNPEQPAQELKPTPIEPDSSKLNSSDPSLDLIRKPIINKKFLQIAACFCGLAVLIGLGFGLQPPRPKPAQANDKGQQEFTKQVPSDLTINPQDFSPAGEPQNASLQPYSVSPNASLVAGKVATPQYGVYPRTPSTEQKVQYPDQQQPPQPQTANQQPTPQNAAIVLGSAFGGSAADEEAKRRLAALTSGFFFPWSSPEQQEQAAKAKTTAQQQADQQAQDQVTAIESAYESPYKKQNMA